MDKKKSISWIIMFLLFITVPTVIAFILGNDLDNENYENRTLTSMPRINKENYDEFPGKFEEYYNDNLPFRNELINLNSKISHYVFKDSSNKQVLLGKEEWLFYLGGAVQTSTGQAELDEHGLGKLAENLNSMKCYLEHEGIEFLVFIAPNKATVYKELLPDNYPIISEKTSGEKLVEYLKDNTDVKVIFPVDELKAVKNEYETYLQYDTHWTNLGAYIGAKLINEQLGIQMPELSELNINEIPETTGDMARMLHLSFEGKGTNYDFEGYDDKWDERSAEMFMEFHNAKGDERTVLVKRDSFGARLFQYFAPEYQNAYFVLEEAEKYIKELKPDIFVWEIVERNAGAINLNIEFVEAEISCTRDTKTIRLYATTSNPLNFVSVIKVNNVADDVEVIQVLKSISEMNIEVPIEETGEFYVSVFGDSEGKELLEEIVIQY